jgi:oligosaccharide repeat unit polymerase
MLQHLPFILFMAFSPESFMKSILEVCNVSIEDAFLKYTLVQTLAYYSLKAGIKVVLGKKNTLQGFSNQCFVNKKALLSLSIVFYIVALSAYCVFLQRIGGLKYLLQHISERVSLQGGQYILTLLNLFYILPLLFMVRIKYNKGRIDKFLLAISVLTYLFIANTLGAREPTNVFIAVLVIGFHYIIRKVVFNRTIIVGTVLLLSMFIVYVISVPIIRNDFDGRKTADFFGIKGVKTFVYQTSYVFIDVFAVNYFTEDNAWMLKGFFDPLKAINAPGDKHNIPQVDQGVYFRSIVKDKRYYEPPIPRGQLSKISWPTENFGFAYANFLLPGIIIFYFLQGLVFGFVYRIMKKSPQNVVLIILYVFVMLYFNFSSLRLAYMVKVMPLVFFVAMLYQFTVLRDKKMTKNGVKI